MGLGGSMKYNDGKYQYTEVQMNLRAKMMWAQIRKHRGFDILVTHAPAYGINDGADLPHRGFATFLALMERYRPRYFLHGHVHMNYSRKHKRRDQYQDTIVINGYERYVLDYEESTETVG
jgi:Icc-related predicted phosphoesterase